MRNKKEKSDAIAEKNAEARRLPSEENDFALTEEEQKALGKNKGSFVEVRKYEPVMQSGEWVVRDVSRKSTWGSSFREITERDNQTIERVRGTVVRPSPGQAHRFLARNSSGEEIEFVVYDTSAFEKLPAEHAKLLEDAPNQVTATIQRLQVVLGVAQRQPGERIAKAIL